MTKLRQAALVTCIALIATSCGDNGDTGTGPSPIDPPQPTVPNVAGTYQGTVEGWLAGVSLGRYPMTATVTQSGDQVTMNGDIEGGVVMFEEAATGTIDASGTVRIEQAADESLTCGTRTNRIFEATFTENAMEFEETADTTGCGESRFQGELQKTGS